MDKCSQLNHLVGLDKYGRAFAPQAGVRPDRQIKIRRDIPGDFHQQFHAVGLPTPGGADPAGTRFQAAAHKGKLLRQVRLDFNGGKARSLGGNTRQIFIKPGADAAVHGMVVGVHPVAGLIFPPLPDGGGILGQHIAPAGIGGLHH